MQNIQFKPIMLIFVLLLMSCSNNNKDTINNKPQTVQKDTAIAQKQNNSAPVMEANQPQIYTVKVLRKIPHSVESFTQGLIYHNGYFFESTGLRGESTLQKIDPMTGKVLKKVKIADRFFAEGIAIFKSKIYLLTWVSNTCLVYDINTFEEIQSFSYYGEGWGLASDGTSLIMSDGSNMLRFMNPKDFQPIKIVSVVDGMQSVKNLNELEYINGEVFANIWETDMIARISPETGKVLGWVDLSPLREFVKGYPRIDVINGIAYNKEKDIYYLTGKYWPYIFEVELLEK
jgi:glutaminyl-peptide cyclotransferase